MTLIKVGKLSCKIIVFILVLIIGSIFFDLKYAKAEEVPTQEVIINELMWMGSSTSIYDEWIELYNNTDSAIDLSGWEITRLNAGSDESMIIIPNGQFIEAKSYFLISNYGESSNSILNIEPDVVNTAVSLSNTNLQLKLFHGSSLVDVAGDGNAPLAGLNSQGQLKSSMERNNIFSDGTKGENWHDAMTSLGFLDGKTEKGTPGAENSSVPIAIPKLLSPANGQIFFQDSTFDFEWEEVEGLNYQLIVSGSSDLSSPIIDINNLNIGKYYWGVFVSNHQESKLSEIWSFEIRDYAKTIIINEICPHPKSGTDNEFIELYNTGSQAVDLSGWFLDDSDGGSSKYKISQGVVIGGKKFMVFERSKTGIILNDNGDSARLLFPNEKVAFSTSYKEYAALDYAWARNTNGSWGWTITPTIGKKNIITVPTKEENAQETQPINTIPIEIRTGSHTDYLGKLVKVTGEVTSTSGSTFYLDDGSGEVKIYIQEKTGIEKPQMHKNDIFEITGIVDLYGKTWRILPQDQDDIKMIEAASKIVKSASVKKVAKKAATTSSDPENLGTSTPKDIAAAESQNENAESDQNTPFWVQMLAAITGLAVIFLIVFILKILRYPKPKTIGGHFGDDET